MRPIVFLVFCMLLGCSKSEKWYSDTFLEQLKQDMATASLPEGAALGEKYEYNILRTDSIVSPYTASVVIPLSHQWKEIENGSTTVDLDLTSAVRVMYACQEDKWVVKEIKLVILSVEDKKHTRSSRQIASILRNQGKSKPINFSDWSDFLAGVNSMATGKL